MPIPSAIPWLLVAILLSPLSRAASPDELVSQLVSQLGDAQFAVREQAQQQLLKQANINTALTVRAMLAAEQHQDPEIRTRVSAALRVIFLRLEIGRGTPEHGLTLSPKLLAVNKQIRTLPVIYRIKQESVSAKAKLTRGDAILSVNGTQFHGKDCAQKLRLYLRKQSVKTKIDITYSRKIDGKQVQFKTTFQLSQPHSSSLKLSADEQVAFQAWKQRFRQKKK